MKKIKNMVLLFLITLFGINSSCAQIRTNDDNKTWIIDSPDEWKQNKNDANNITFSEGMAVSNQTESKYSSVLKSFKTKQKAKSITFKQTVSWDNWHEINKLTLPEMLDAPVLISVKNHDYWILARRYDTNPKNLEETQKTHSDDELGYHAWHSSDMKNWKHYGPVSGYIQRWVTTAEFFDGKFYIYYDNPNDEDPHLIIDKDLTDGKMGENIGLVFNDPTHGSDCAVIRDEDGTFHLIYENWDYNNAREHSWDAPVAGHAVSNDGIHDFQIKAPIVDERKKATGTFSTFLHPYKAENYTTMKYEVHEPEQEAFGDWTSIKIGSQYYLFGDYDPVGEKIRIGKFTSNSLNETFEFCGELGMGHPDPTVAFAEGQFYLIQQSGNVDFVSSGPWVPGVEVRVGVDVNGDEKVNKWTNWHKIEESYSHKEGYARLVDVEPASVDLSDLPDGLGFSFEYKTIKLNEPTAKVKMQSVEIVFQ